jgi:hypothetical protein
MMPSGMTPPPSPPIISTRDTNTLPTSDNMTLEDLLEVAVDVDRLVQSARTSFRLIESQYEELSR